MVQILFIYTEYSRLVSQYIKSCTNIHNQFSACHTTVLPVSVNLVMEETAKHSMRGARRVMFYYDDLVLSPESEIEVVECLNMCKAAMERRSLKVNYGKMKILVSGKECDFVVTLGNVTTKHTSHSCEVCCRRVCREVCEMY